ncbi:MAG: recombinase family protein [Pseudomonadota bacterium]
MREKSHLKTNADIIAVSYARVSSAQQVAKGQGAESQAARCKEFAKIKGYRVVRSFEDKAVSGSVIERPGMQDLLAYVRKHRKDNIRVLIDDISRLARGLEAHLALRAAIADAGGVLESPSIEFGEDSDSQLIEHLLASVSQHARVKKCGTDAQSNGGVDTHGLLAFLGNSRLSDGTKRRAW